MKITQVNTIHNLPLGPTAIKRDNAMIIHYHSLYMWIFSLTIYNKNVDHKHEYGFVADKMLS